MAVLYSAAWLPSMNEEPVFWTGKVTEKSAGDGQGEKSARRPYSAGAKKSWFGWDIVFRRPSLEYNVRGTVSSL